MPRHAAPPTPWPACASSRWWRRQAAWRDGLAARGWLWLGLRRGRRTGRGTGRGSRPRRGASGRRLRLLAEQAELPEARIDHHAHHFHHAAVVDRLVAADEDALVGLLVVHRLELAAQLLQLVPGLAEVDLVL